VAGFLIIPDYEAPTLFQVADTALDRISVAILLFVAGWWATGTLSGVSPNTNGRLDPFIRAPLPDPVGIVSPIALGPLRVASGAVLGTEGPILRSSGR
jgi:hypothetical protein